MAFDEALAGRIRDVLETRRDIAEKRMFGGLAFLLHGNMCCGVHGNEMIVRVKPAEAERLEAKPGVRRFDLTGRPMKGWLLVAPNGLASAAALNRWVNLAVDFAGSLRSKA